LESLVYKQLHQFASFPASIHRGSQGGTTLRGWP